jgi:HAMP domain-containing protein
MDVLTMAMNEDVMKRKEIRIQIPIFFKLMISMLIVATIPIFLLGMVSMGGTESIIAAIGLQPTIILLTVVTLGVVLMWSFFLASSITSPIVKLSTIAHGMSQGEIKTSEIEVMTNDEIGELVTSFNKLINTYRILDTLAKDDMTK